MLFPRDSDFDKLSSSVLISTFPSPGLAASSPTDPAIGGAAVALLPLPTPPNPCSLYFLNVLIDTTVGVLIIWGLLRLARWTFVEQLGWKGWEMGMYEPGKMASCWVRGCPMPN